MPSTYTLISSNVLSSGAASVTFSAIPSTYTDLVLKLSVRSLYSDVFDVLQTTLNGSTANFSGTRINGNGAAASSNTTANLNTITYGNAATSTTNTFSNIEVYFPSYTASQNKPFSAFTAHENNNTTAYLQAAANLWSNTAAINSIQISTSSSSNFAIGSSFYLYGIKNS